MALLKLMINWIARFLGIQTDLDQIMQARLAKDTLDYKSGRQACIDGDPVCNNMSPSWYEGYAEQYAKQKDDKG